MILFHFCLSFHSIHSDSINFRGSTEMVLRSKSVVFQLHSHSRQFHIQSHWTPFMKYCSLFFKNMDLPVPSPTFMTFFPVRSSRSSWTNLIIHVLHEILSVAPCYVHSKLHVLLHIQTFTYSNFFRAALGSLQNITPILISRHWITLLLCLECCFTLFNLR